MAKKIIDTADYTFDASAKTVTFSTSYSGIQIQNIELITNLVDNVIIYQFNKPTKGGVLSGRVLTLTHDTTTMSDSDELQIFVEANFLTENVNTGLAQPLTDAQLRASDVKVTLDGESVPVTGTFWPTTQPISGNVNTGLSQPLTDTQLRAADVKVSLDGEVVPVTGTFFQATQPVSASALPLPSGASTSALQSTGNTSLSNIDTKTPALGQALASASTPVVLTAAQISTLTPQTNALTDTQLRATPIPVSLTSTAVSNFPSTQTVSGSVSVSNFPTTQTNALTNAELRASAIPVSVGSTRNRVGQYALSSFRTLGTAATPQNIFTIENPLGSTKKIALKKLEIIFDTTAALATVSPSIKFSRLSTLPTSGTVLAATKWNTTDAAAVAICRGGTASDGGVATPITATAGNTITTQFVDRQQTAAGFIQHREYTLLFELAKDDPFVINANESVLIQGVIANAATTHFVVNIIWEEYT